MKTLFLFLLLFIVLFPPIILGDEKLAMLETEAKSHLGGSYVWGGVNPTGFDCSGYTRYVYQKLGLSLPRTALEQSRVGRPVPPDQLEKGDLLFFLTDRSRGLPITHVGIYLGEGQFIHAAGHKEGIITSSLSGKYGRLFVRATRPTDMDLNLKNAVMTRQFFSVEYQAVHAPTKVEVNYNFFTLKDGKYTRE